MWLLHNFFQLQFISVHLAGRHYYRRILVLSINKDEIYSCRRGLSCRHRFCISGTSSTQWTCFGKNKNWCFNCFLVDCYDIHDMIWYDTLIHSNPPLPALPPPSFMVTTHNRSKTSPPTHQQQRTRSGTSITRWFSSNRRRRPRVINHLEAAAAAVAEVRQPAKVVRTSRVSC